MAAWVQCSEHAGEETSQPDCRLLGGMFYLNMNNILVSLRKLAFWGIGTVTCSSRMTHPYLNLYHIVSSIPLPPVLEVLAEPVFRCWMGSSFKGLQ